jgi:antitoxin YefM
MGIQSMLSITLDHAKQDLEAVVARVLADSEPTILNTPSGESVVVLPLEDFEAWQETNYLLRTPANAEHLRRSISEAESGRASPRQHSE